MKNFFSKIVIIVDIVLSLIRFIKKKTEKRSKYESFGWQAKDIYLVAAKSYHLPTSNIPGCFVKL